MTAIAAVTMVFVLVHSESPWTDTPHPVGTGAYVRAAAPADSATRRRMSESAL